MATRQMTVTWCDQHLQQGIEEPGTPRPELKALLGVVPDLCDPDYKELTARLFQLLESVSAELTQATPSVIVSVQKEVVPALEAMVTTSGPRRLGPKYRGKRNWVCIFGDEEYGSISGIRHHMERVHGVPWAEAGIQEVYGHVCPLDGEDMGHGKQSATLHARDRHRANNVSKLFERAVKKGDRFGVVQSRLEALRG